MNLPSFSLIDDFFVYRPARVLDTQVSIDDYRRSKLSNILRAHEPRVKRRLISKKIVLTN